MKKRILLLSSALVFGLALGVTSCGEGGQQVTPEGEFKINVTCPEGASYTLSQTSADENDAVTLKVSVEKGYTLTSVTKNGEILSPNSKGDYVFLMPNSDVSIVIAITKDAVPQKYRIYTSTSSSALHFSTSVEGDVALEGTEVTITATVDENYVINSAKLNGKVITLKDGKYTFTMPSTNAIFTFEIGVLNAKVALQGDIAVAFTEEADKPGVYSVRNFEIKEESKVVLVVNDKTYGVECVDMYNSFAGLELTASTERGFKISGNSKYDFVVDTNRGEKNFLTIQRTELTSLPDTKDKLEDLLSSNIRGHQGTYPSGVTSVNFTDSTKNIKYDYKLYNNNTSLGRFTNEAGSVEKGITYNKYEESVSNLVKGDGLLSVVDTFNETALYGTDDYLEAESHVYSGKYGVVNSYSADSTSRVYNRNFAEFRVNEYSFNTEDLRRLIGKAVFDQFTDGQSVIGNEGYIDGKATINTTEIETGYNVDITTWKKYEANPDKYAEDRYVEYAVNIKLDKRGAIDSGVYHEEHFNLVDGEKGTPISNSSVDFSFDYTYNEKLTDCDFDSSKYFISSIQNLDFRTQKTANTDTPNTVQLNGLLDLQDKRSNYTKFDFKETTALDKWQYNIISSSNENVIKKTPNNYYTALKLGTSDLTIGNGITNDVTAKQTVTVKSVSNPHTFSMIEYETKDGRWVSNGYAPDYMNFTTNSITLNYGEVQRIRVSATPSDSICPFKIVSDNPAVTVTQDSTDYSIISIDSTKLDTSADVKLTLTAENFTTETIDPETGSTITVPDKEVFTIKYTSPLDENFGGTFTSMDYASDVVTLDAATKTGTVTSVSDGGETLTGTFNYTITANGISVSNVKISLPGSRYSSFDLFIVYQDNDHIGVTLTGMVFGTGWDDSYEDTIIGGFMEDGSPAHQLFERTK